ncbi:MAG TPA: transaldolase family protein [Solirubrobacteraceae bacterium]|nr:transaldolase family protein [Solirubrobacteraceae bacterium]
MTSSDLDLAEAPARTAAAQELEPLALTALTATDYWNDSCSIEDLTYAIERGATGATSNPTIVGEVLTREMPLWRDRIGALIDDNPEWTEDEVAWRLIEEMAVRAAELLLPVFEREQGRKGRLSIQTDPRLYRSADRIVAQGLRFSGLAPNMQVKVPATRAGITAIEELTAAGVSINATVCFTVPQAIAVAEAVQRGLTRHEANGGDTSAMSPVCTIMVGRLDDWMGVLAKRDGIVVDPGLVHWAGIAAFKRAYGIFGERGYRTRLLAAAYRHHLHWSELIGGDIVLTIPCAWQRLFNASDIEVVPRIDNPVAPEIVASLQAHFPDFRRAYEPDGLSIDEFDSYGATVRTLRGFIASYHDLVATIRDIMLPNPDRA